MTEPQAASRTPQSAKSMDEIMALCKRRGFIYQASEIYGGINGFWDYGPLGTLLKKNLRDAWWEDVVLRPCWGRTGPDGEPVSIAAVDTCIIQNPRVWEASGHVAGFNDPRVDCRESKQRYRYDHLFVVMPCEDTGVNPMYAFVPGDETEAAAHKRLAKHLKQELPLRDCHVKPLKEIPLSEFHRIYGPHASERGTLTEPRPFNLMFPTVIGATGDPESDKAYLRPETAQGIFVNFKNVVDTTRIKVPFGIAQTGKAFRNEVTPRNFTFRSREFEQMEVEFFCHESEAMDWYRFWRDWRMEWWRSIGLAGENLQLREHGPDELSHYSKATSDIEYRFPFTAPGFGELEGVAYRGDFDLRQHQQHSGAKLEYFDTERGEVLPNGSRRGERYLPHVVEPSAGLDRGVLALICEAYTKDPSRPSPELLRFHPRVAPIKAAVFPLVNKDGMPEVAAKLHADLVKRFWKVGAIETDPKQSIGKRYARMDEAGCPWCFTIDGQTLQDQTVTVRDRDSGGQERIGIAQVAAYLAERLGT